jgi:hypothetical protein
MQALVNINEQGIEIETIITSLLHFSLLLYFFPLFHFVTSFLTLDERTSTSLRPRLWKPPDGGSSLHTGMCEQSAQNDHDRWPSQRRESIIYRSSVCSLRARCSQGFEQGFHWHLRWDKRSIVPMRAVRSGSPSHCLIVHLCISDPRPMKKSEDFSMMILRQLESS